jgi:DNA polymerase-3 subunit delta'
MRYSEVISSSGHSDYLRHAIETGSLPHAMLFFGHEGTGKLATALATVEYLMCKDKEDGHSCGECTNCIKNAKYAHPDVHYVFPIFGAKNRSTDFYPQWRKALSENPYLGIQDWLKYIDADNKQLNISSGECNRIVEQLGLKAFEGQYKVLLVWMAEWLGKEANRWLKLIEEPADNTIIILIAEDRNAILPTILSRCQQFYFKPLTVDLISNELQRRLGVEEERAGQIASASKGSWNLASQIAGNKRFNPVKWMEDWVHIVWSGDLARIRKWTEDMNAMSREENKQYQQYVIEVLQKLYWIKWGIDFDADKEERAMLDSLNKKIEFNELEDLVNLSENNLRALRRNGRANMIWLDASIKMRTALKNYHGQIGV